MHLQTLSKSDLSELPLCGIAVVALQAAGRVRFIYEAWNPTTELLTESEITLCEAVLTETLPTPEIYSLSEKLYSMAASAAANYRVHGTPDSQQASIAGGIAHSAVDCIADLFDDPSASLTNGMLTLRGCGKLNNKQNIHQVKTDLEFLKTNVPSDVERSKILKYFEEQ